MNAGCILLLGAPSTNLFLYRNGKLGFLQNITTRKTGISRHFFEYVKLSPSIAINIVGCLIDILIFEALVSNYVFKDLMQMRALVDMCSFYHRTCLNLLSKYCEVFYLTTFVFK